MARNRMAMSNTIFGRLIAYADTLGVPIKDPTEKRFIVRQSLEDADLMARAKVTSYEVTKNIRLFRLVHKDSIYFCVFGLSQIDDLPTGLNRHPITPGILQSCIVEGDIQPSRSISGYDVKDAIEAFPINEEGKYLGHELESIARLFPAAFVYTASGAEDYHSSDLRVISSLLARSYEDGPLSLGDQNIIGLIGIMEGGSPHIPYENILQGMLSIYWGNLFLELYRCIEQLYAAPRIIKLCEHWPSTVSIHDLAEKLEKTLGWRPKEDDALARLLSECDPSTIESACSAFEVVDLDDEDMKSTPAERLAKSIYRLRNSLVHFRPATKMTKKKDAEWRVITDAMIGLVDELYAKHGERFFPPLAA